MVEEGSVEWVEEKMCGEVTEDVLDVIADLSKAAENRDRLGSIIPQLMQQIEREEPVVQFKAFRCISNLVFNNAERLNSLLSQGLLDSIEKHLDHLDGSHDYHKFLIGLFYNVVILLDKKDYPQLFRKLTTLSTAPSSVDSVKDVSHKLLVLLMECPSMLDAYLAQVATYWTYLTSLLDRKDINETKLAVEFVSQWDIPLLEWLIAQGHITGLLERVEGAPDPNDPIAMEVLSLFNSWFDDEDILKLFVPYIEVIMGILGTLNQHPSFQADQPIFLGLLKAVSLLSMENEVCIALHRHVSFISQLAVHSEAPGNECALYCSMLLGNMAGSKEGCDALLKGGDAQQVDILSVLLALSEKQEDKITHLVVGTLRNLVVEEDCRLKVGQYPGLMDMLARSLDCKHAHLKFNALLTMRALFAHIENMQAFIQCGGLAPLMRLSETKIVTHSETNPKEDHRVHLEGARLLYRLISAASVLVEDDAARQQFIIDIIRMEGCITLFQYTLRCNFTILHLECLDALTYYMPIGSVYDQLFLLEDDLLDLQGRVDSDKLTIGLEMILSCLQKRKGPKSLA